MNTRIIFPLAAAASLAVAAVASAADRPAHRAMSERIVELPAVTVHPASQDAAYFRAHRIVDLPRITVRPDPSEWALLLADNTVRVLHLPVAPTRGSALDGQMAAVSAYALAAR